VNLQGGAGSGGEAAVASLALHEEAGGGGGRGAAVQEAAERGVQDRVPRGAQVCLKGLKDQGSFRYGTSITLYFYRASKRQCT
jgi:hypothetical protein